MRYGLFLLIMLPMMVAQAQVAEDDSLALVALYNATDGPNWARNDNWLTGPVSQWASVGVTGNRVTSLAFDNNQLTGSIPPELGNLTNLTYLWFSSNNLTGSIPAELSRLTNLTQLVLSYNQLTCSIPSELESLANLTFLSLFGNQLTGSIPPELGNIPGLADLWLFYNQLTGSIPPELGNLANLTRLWLYQNNLTGSIPPELGRLANLTQLFLDNNQLTGSIPPELGSSFNLRDLHLRGNPLSGSLPVSLINLSLNSFHFDNTSVCEPSDEAFQAWLQTIPFLTSTSVICVSTAAETSTELPSSYTLRSSYPNPFNLQTTIRYGLPQAASVRLVVFDAIGRHARVLVEGMQPPGWHEVVFEAGDLPSGVYFYHLKAASFEASGQMLLLK